MSTTTALQPRAGLQHPFAQATAGAGVASRVLHIPLTLKLVGANALILVAAIVATALRGPDASGSSLMIPIGTLAVGATMNLLLVGLALRPIRDLERTVGRLWNGETTVRVPVSDVSDAALDQVGGTLNTLLDRLDDDRTRMRNLAAEVIKAEDRERARIGHELHDSIAQTLVAITYQLSAAERESADSEIAARLREIRIQASEVLDRVDILSHTVHPRVLNDLGLVPALRQLARTAADRAVPVEVRVLAGSDDAFRGLGHSTASAFYRIAQEAVQNATRHARARKVIIDVAAGEALRMTVSDDGQGFSLADARARRPVSGLFTIGERAELINATFTIDTEPGRGTRVSVSIPNTPGAQLLASHAA